MSKDYGQKQNDIVIQCHSHKRLCGHKICTRLKNICFQTDVWCMMYTWYSAALCDNWARDGCCVALLLQSPRIHLQYVKREYHEICEFNNFAAHLFVAINLTRFIFRRNLKIPMICCLPRKREKSPDDMDLTGSLEYFVLLPECWDGNRFPAFLGYPVYGRLSNLTRPDAAYQKLSSYRYAAAWSEGYFCKDLFF